MTRRYKITRKRPILIGFFFAIKYKFVIILIGSE